jgi:hypothetical protein
VAAIIRSTAPTSSERRRSNRVLIILAAAWLAVALAIGGAAADGPSVDQVPGHVTADEASQP